MPISHTDFSTDGPKNLDNKENRVYWWKQQGDEAAKAVAALATLLYNNQSARRTQLISSTHLYSNMPLLGFFGWGLSRGPSNQQTPFEKVRLNVVQMAIDTLVSRIGKGRPQPMHLTNGGDWSLRNKAKKLNKFIQGVFADLMVYDAGMMILRDAAVWGTGITYAFMEAGRLNHERVLPFEIFIDEIEGTFANPRTLIRCRQVDRHVVLERWGKDNKEIAEILDASTAVAEGSSYAPGTADMIDVYEAWHLPSSPTAHDGKHIVCIDGHALTEMEEWEHPFFPFAFLHYSPRLIGFWGQGLAEQIQSIQVELNRLMRLKQWSFHKAATYKVLMEMGSKIDTEHINNDVGAIIKYTGTKPEWVVPPVIPPAFLEYEQSLKQDALNQPGINQVSAQGQVPMNIKSGKAMRVYDNLETDRLQTVGRAYERYFMDLGRIDIALVRDHGKGYHVKVKHRTWLETIDWKSINLDEEDYQISCFPVSSLPNDPAGRLETIQEFAAAGMYTLREAKRLFGFPDLEQVDTLQTAAEEYILKIIDEMMETGVVTRLEPYDDLQMALEIGMETYQLAKCHNADEDKLELLRQFIDDAKGMLAASIAAAQPPPAPGMGAPQANPGPTPVSPLLPTAPKP